MSSQFSPKCTGGTSNTGPYPSNRWIVASALTDETSSGPKLSIANEPMTISATNSAPAIGAL